MDDPFESARRAARVNAAARPVRIEGEVVTRQASDASETVPSFLRHLRGRGLETPARTGRRRIAHAPGWVADGALEQAAAEITWAREHRADST